ncbi:hypothetical protein AGLY_002767 [Aphis glycines]|uniref:Uncharacterized protein n=1 Tax=Aphis glycines TaxID=307491 RepID=A0A6G0U3Q0_APHGL|nr:hypothetical protein AGLY_002767 [Aphis glycines]
MFDIDVIDISMSKKLLHNCTEIKLSVISIENNNWYILRIVIYKFTKLPQYFPGLSYNIQSVKMYVILSSLLILLSYSLKHHLLYAILFFQQPIYSQNQPKVYYASMVHVYLISNFWAMRSRHARSLALCIANYFYVENLLKAPFFWTEYLQSFILFLLSGFSCSYLFTPTGIELLLSLSYTSLVLFESKKSFQSSLLPTEMLSSISSELELLLYSSSINCSLSFLMIGSGDSGSFFSMIGIGVGFNSTFDIGSSALIFTLIVTLDLVLCFFMSTFFSLVVITVLWFVTLVGSSLEFINSVLGAIFGLTLRDNKILRHRSDHNIIVSSKTAENDNNCIVLLHSPTAIAVLDFRRRTNCNS